MNRELCIVVSYLSDLQRPDGPSNRAIPRREKEEKGGGGGAVRVVSTTAGGVNPVACGRESRELSSRWPETCGTTRREDSNAQTGALGGCTPGTRRPASSGLAPRPGIHLTDYFNVQQRLFVWRNLNIRVFCVPKIVREVACFFR